MNQPTDADYEVDVVVVGAGMAGLTVAARLAELGRTVALVEVATEPGGSAIMSEGYVWTAPSVEVFRERDPEGDEERFERMLGELPEAFAWLGSLGVTVGDPLTAVLGYGEGRQIDVREFVHKCMSIVDRGDNMVLLGTSVRSLSVSGGVVVGVVVDDGEGGTATIGARAVVLATGGFQADPAAREEFMSAEVRDVVLRSNTFSTGDGIRAGMEVGADLAGPRDGFYGHLVPYPLERFEPPDYAALAQYFSDHGILVGHDGARFCDESRGDHENTERVASRGRALLIIDERIRRTEVLRPFIKGMDSIDKLAAGGARGAHYVSAPTIDEVAAAAADWGYDADRIVTTVAEFGTALRDRSELVPPRGGHREPLAEPPFAAIEVQAAMTFTYRGLATDVDGRVVRAGDPIPGLFAAGVDAGALNVRGYTGGLVRGLALGRLTAAAIDQELS